MRIVARIQEMSDSAILRMIPHDVYEDIKRRDAHPVFRAYVVGHEGDSTGKLVGVGRVVKRWYKSAIRALTEKLQFGTKIFHDHVESNRHEGRSIIGEVVGKSVETLKNKLTSIAIAYIYPSYVNLPLDVASIEADLWIDPDEKGFADVDVKNISGVALGNSRQNVPGFPGATLIGELQAFSQSHQFNERGGGMEITLSDIRAFIRTEGLSPSDLFGVGTLMKDENISSEVEKIKKEAVTGEYKHRKRDEEGFDKKRDELEAKIADLEKQNKTLNLQITSHGAGKDQFDKIITERKIEGKKKDFIEKKFKKNFKLKEEDKIRDEIEKFVDAEVDDYNETAKLLGVEVKEEKTAEEIAKEAEGKKAGSPEDKTEGTSDDLLDPKNNPLIPQA
jgi:hypothetical protein